MMLLPRLRLILLWSPILTALIGCASWHPSASVAHGQQISGGLAGTAAAAGVFGPMTWAGVALVCAGIVSWLLGNRSRALLMIATGAGLAIATLLVLEIASLLVWPVVIAAIVAGVTLLGGWGWPRWRKWIGR